MSRSFALAVAAALLLAAPSAVLAQFSAQLSPPRFEEQANAGGVYRDVIEVYNTSNLPLRLKVGTADWALDAQGNAEFSKSLVEGSCRPWTAIEAQEIEVEARSKRRFRFEVRVPEGTPDGQCRFAILFEGEPVRVPNMPMPVAGRIGIIVYLDIGKGAARLVLDGSGVREEGGRKLPYLTVRNDGNAHGRLQGFLDARDAAGRKWTFTPAGHPVLPGARRDIVLFPVLAEGETADLAFPLAISGRTEWKGSPFAVEAQAAE
ncbi:hypothetical protein [Arenimonas aestuarii]